MKNWKTTVAGVLSLAMAVFKFINDPKSAGEPDTIAAITAGVGLVLAKDWDVTGKPRK